MPEWIRWTDIFLLVVVVLAITIAMKHCMYAQRKMKIQPTKRAKPPTAASIARKGTWRKQNYIARQKVESTRAERTGLSRAARRYLPPRPLSPRSRAVFTHIVMNAYAAFWQPFFCQPIREEMRSTKSFRALHDLV